MRRVQGQVACLQPGPLYLAGRFPASAANSTSLLQGALPARPPGRCCRRRCALTHPTSPTRRRLWKLGDPAQTLNELRRIPAADLSAQQLERYVKLDNRDGIRTRNENRAK